MIFAKELFGNTPNSSFFYRIGGLLPPLDGEATKKAFPSGDFGATCPIVNQLKKPSPAGKVARALASDG